MHFREVNNKLKQLKSNVFTISEQLTGLNYCKDCFHQNDEYYQQVLSVEINSLSIILEQAQQDLEVFRNTIIGQLS